MKNLNKQERAFINNIQKKISKTIFKNNLIQAGDKILVGLSGGKDSLILLDALASRRRALPFDYTLAAAHISSTHNIYEADIDFMKKICEFYNIEFFLETITLDFKKDDKLSPCFICSWNRRTELYKLTTRKGFNKLAFGHHMNDAVETLLMNMAFNGEISSIPYKVSMFQEKFEIIRPLLEIEESLLIEYSELKNFNKEIKSCNYSTISSRESIRQIINELSKINKDVFKNIFRSMNKIRPDYLPENNYSTQRKKQNN